MSIQKPLSDGYRFKGPAPSHSIPRPSATASRDITACRYSIAQPMQQMTRPVSPFPFKRKAGPLSKRRDIAVAAIGEHRSDGSTTREARHRAATVHSSHRQGTQGMRGSEEKTENEGVDKGPRTFKAYGWETIVDAVKTARGPGWSEGSAANHRISKYLTYFMCVLVVGLKIIFILPSEEIKKTTSSNRKNSCLPISLGTDWVKPSESRCWINFPALSRLETFPHLNDVVKRVEIVRPQPKPCGTRKIAD